MVAGYKVSFLFGFIPLLFIFPYREYAALKRARAKLGELLLLLLPLFLLFVYHMVIGQISFSASWKGRVSPLSVFTISYWRDYGPIIWHYVKNENFTLIYFVLSIGGIIKLWVDFKKDKSLFARYLRGWSLLIIPYFLFFSDYLNQHNYYQMPFLSFICLAIVYFLKELSIFVGSCLKRRIKSAHISVFIFGIVFLFSLNSLSKNIFSQFSVIYPGTDEIGKLLRKMTAKKDRLFIYTFAQGYAPCVYAERKCGWCGSLDEFRINEQKFSIKYVIVYPYYYINNIGEDIKNYLNNNYHLKIVGLVAKRLRFIPVIMVLEKGGTLDIRRFYNDNRKIRLENVYNTLSGPLAFYTLSSEK